MEVRDKVAVVTGGAHGIGRAFCERFARDGAKAVVVADRDFVAAKEVAAAIDGLPIECDVAIESQVFELVRQTTDSYGPIDLFCSNAGVILMGGLDVADEEWQNIWNVNVMSHLYAARAVIPGMLERGSGYLLNTVSAAGLLTQLASAPYSVTKHAALSLAEWLAITYGDRGIKVSCVCPLGVQTAMLTDDHPIGTHLMKDAATPDEVADAAVVGLREEKFLILPHPQVATYFEHKALDYDRWLHGMRRFQARLESGGRRNKNKS